MKTILIFLTASLLALSCNTKKNTTTENNSDKPSEEEVSYVFKNVSPNDSLFASIYRGACFGRCPVYELKIYNNGLVVLKGKNFVDKIGEYVMELSPNEMMTFVSKAKEIKYFELDDSYDNKNVTDLPGTSTTIVIDGKRKKVYSRIGAPKELKEFEALFDALIKSNKWVKRESEADKKF